MEDIEKMVSKDGFIGQFWRRVHVDRELGKSTPFRVIYERMESEFRDRYGCRRFPSYDAFRYHRDKH